MNNEFVMLCGIPGAGKTVFTEKYRDCNVHSSDAIRAELFGDESHQDGNAAVFDVLHGRVKADITSGVDTIYDATNLHWKRRRGFLDELKRYDCIKTLVLFATPFDVCMENNRNRGRVVPEDVLTRMYRGFSFPYYYEGWDKIIIEWNFSPDNYILDWKFAELMDFDQNNHHHSMTLGGHLLATAEALNGKSKNNFMYNVGLLHDIGKPFVEQAKWKSDLGVYESVYHDHHSVSAYEAMFYLKSKGYSDGEILKMCTIIYWHMQPYFCKEQKTLDKYEKIWGTKLFNYIMMLHEADVSAH